MTDSEYAATAPLEHRPAGVGGRIAFAVALLVITLPFAIMVPWQMHGGRNAIAEVAGGSELVLVVLVFTAATLIARQHAHQSDQAG